MPLASVANKSHFQANSLPANLLHSDADTVGVDDHGDVQEEEVETATLGARAVLEALDCIEGLQRGPAPAVKCQSSMYIGILKIGGILTRRRCRKDKWKRSCHKPDWGAPRTRR